MVHLVINHTLTDKTSVRLLVDESSIVMVPLSRQGRVALTFDYWAGQNVNGRWIGWDPNSLNAAEKNKLKNTVRKEFAPILRDRIWKSIQDDFKRGKTVTVEFQINL